MGKYALPNVVFPLLDRLLQCYNVSVITSCELFFLLILNTITMKLRNTGKQCKQQ